MQAGPARQIVPSRLSGPWSDRVGAHTEQCSAFAAGNSRAAATEDSGGCGRWGRGRGQGNPGSVTAIAHGGPRLRLSPRLGISPSQHSTVGLDSLGTVPSVAAAACAGSDAVRPTGVNGRRHLKVSKGRCHCWLMHQPKPPSHRC